MEENSIKNQDHILKVYFQMVSSREILDGYVEWNHFPREKFVQLCRNEMPYLSDTELSLIYKKMLESHESGNELENGTDVFCLLKSVASEMLTVREAQPVCRYECLLRWRMLVQVLGEDLPICAFLAVRDERITGSWSNFEWNTVITHDNIQLTRILEKGCADNHFHLFGSAPYFHLIWLKLMNHPANPKCRNAIREMDKHKRVASIVFTSNDTDEPLEELVYKAALIRYSLFSILYRASTGEPYEPDNLSVEINDVDCKLKSSGSLNFEYENLQRLINSMRSASSSYGPQNDMDYALLGTSGKSIHHDFEGERAFLYQMLLGHVGNFIITPTMMRWFYAYTVIKGKVYRELIQVNDTVGFENFSIYSNRKKGFLFSADDYKQMVRHAVVETFESNTISFLEMRITPLNSVKDYRNTILTYDNYISDRMKNPELLDKCCYVIHFPKAQDKAITNRDDNPYKMSLSCRHQKYREKIATQAHSLVRFRTQAQAEAKRVVGIDACALEIGCRPEVFGPIFRMLSEHVVPGRNIYGVGQLKITYHVGEDFLDLTDGLRAIDETMLFLNLKRGDRLGHATALGLDVKSWYEFKKMRINIPKHDYLDNVVWLYHKLLEYNISDCENLKEYLVIEYNKAFDEIYGDSLDDQFVADIARVIDDKRGDGSCLHDKSNVCGYRYFDIYAFYDAWKLRGDDPECYLRDIYVDTLTRKLQYKERINWKIDGGEAIRSNPKAVALYLMYHYSVSVRHKGAEICMKEIPRMYVDGVERVQKKMQWQVASKGIGIETNPSSNYQISTIRQYKDHPISSMYNLGLTMEPIEIRNCPQLNVSINTDDRGVFHTSLENEFAIMGCAMEYVDMGNGTYRYQGQMVYDWLDNIREMGLNQRFME